MSSVFGIKRGLMLVESVMVRADEIFRKERFFKKLKYIWSQVTSSRCSVDTVVSQGRRGPSEMTNSGKGFGSSGMVLEILV